jgi:hypothetical protein
VYLDPSGEALGRFKAMAGFEWNWPTHLHRPTVERVFTLDFLAQRENVVIVAPNGLGKTMLAKNLVHQAILAGHSARFTSGSEGVEVRPNADGSVWFFVGTDQDFFGIISLHYTRFMATLTPQ